MEQCGELHAVTLNSFINLRRSDGHIEPMARSCWEMPTKEQWSLRIQEVMKQYGLAGDGEMVPEDNGLIAYSDSEEHSVLQLG